MAKCVTVIRARRKDVAKIADYLRAHAADIESSYFLESWQGRLRQQIRVLDVEARPMSIAVITEGDDISSNNVSDAIRDNLPDGVENVRIPYWS